MTCLGTERVFVNPAACQSASELHKPLSTASPLTRPTVPAGPGSEALQGLASCQLPCSCSRGPQASLTGPPYKRGPWTGSPGAVTSLLGA